MCYAVVMLFQLLRHQPGDKELTIEGPDITIRVDFDDVDTTNVMAITRRMVKTINSHFTLDHGQIDFSERTGKIKFTPKP